MSFTEITVTELATKLADNDRQYQFIDVREQRELELVALPKFIHLPLSEHNEWSLDLDPVWYEDQIGRASCRERV